MKKKICMFLALTTIVLTAGCGTKVKLKDGKEVIASVDGLEITAEELFDSLKESYGSTAVLKVIDNFIISKEIEDQASYKKAAEAQLTSMKNYYASYNYEWSDVLSYYGFSTDDDFVKSYMSDSMVNDIVVNFLGDEVSDDEIQKYYDEEIYGDYTVKHILITPETTDDMTDDEKTAANDAAKEKAEEVIEKLNNGENWADLVTEYSDDDQTKDSEGELPAFTNGDYVDSFFDATIALKDGEYTKEPVESTYGYHIILRVSATDKPSLEDSKDTVKKKVAENKLSNDENLASATWIRIREKYNLNIADSTIEKKYNESK